MGEKTVEEINVIELLMGIKEDVASIKTEVATFQKNQEKDKADTDKDLCDIKKSIAELEKKVNEKIEEMSKEIERVKHRETERDARKWKTSVAFILTALAGMVIAKIPDFIVFIAEKALTKGN